MKSVSASAYRIVSGLDSSRASLPELPSIEHKVPPLTAAVIQALRFRGRSTAGLASVPEHDWPRLIDWCTRKQVILLLAEFCPDALPAFVQTQVANLERGFEQRTHRLVEQLGEVADILNAQGIEFVVLKGFSHSPELTPNMLWRAQGDIDLLCRKAIVYEAHQALRAHGYVTRPSNSKRHLPALIRPNKWVWDGNYADIPVGIELHYKLWSDAAEHIAIPGHDEMWQRRTPRPFFGRTYGVLCRCDVLGFAALHFLLHLLHGDLPLQRAWEIASFLHQRSHDEYFWQQWQRLHPPKLRSIEALVFKLMRLWFWCDTPECLQEELSRLPQSAQLWLQHFPFAPLSSEQDRNKNHLWLHLALTESLRDRAAVARQNLLPIDIRGALTACPVSATSNGWQRGYKQLRFLGNRIHLHVRGAFPTLRGGFTLWRHRRKFKKLVPLSVRTSRIPHF